MRRIYSILMACVFGALLAGCATALPVDEVRQANAAYDAAAAAGAPLLDELAIAERQAALKGAQTGDVLRDDDLVVPLTLDVKDAASFASIGDPPSTAIQRRGLKVVGAYFDVLEILAEGRNIDEAKAQIQVLASDVAGLATLATGGASLAVGPIISALNPIIEAAARTQNAQELRRLVLEGAKPVEDLIVALKTSSPQIFTVLITESESAATGPLLENKPARRAELLKIVAYRVSVANYAVLLEQLRVAFRSLVSAVQSPSRVTLSSLSATANELLIAAESVRRAYAILRRPGATGSSGEIMP